VRRQKAARNSLRAEAPLLLRRVEVLVESDPVDRLHLPLIGLHDADRLLGRERRHRPRQLVAVVLGGYAVDRTARACSPRSSGTDG